MKIIFSAFLVILNLSLAAQDPFILFTEKDQTWQASVFELYALQYAGIDISKDMIDLNDISTIEEEIKIYPHETTEEIDEAVKASASGKKVFFFIENYVWGGLEEGTLVSGSWEKNMPLCSGFYPGSGKCFKNEGLNYHCGKKETSFKTRFVIMK